MIPKLTFQRHFWILSMLLLAACSNASQDATKDRTPTSVATAMDSSPSTAAPTMSTQATAAIPSSTDLATDPLLTATRRPLPFMELEGLRTVYTNSNGDLYLYDGGKQAIQLTRGVKESTQQRPPLISDDGQKVIFYRAGEANLDSVYTINADGTREQVLVDPERLSAFGGEYDAFTTLFSLAFVPGSHLLLFNTYQQNNFDADTAGWMPLVGNDLFIVDTDTAEIKQLKASLQGGNFAAAPNGQWVAVQTLDHIDVIDVEGQMIHPNLVTYDKTEAHISIPMSWTENSQELIMLPSEVPLYLASANTMSRTVWRYPVMGGPGTEIKLTPPPVYDAFAISPDGNWLAYIYGTESDLVAPADTPFGLYLGDLHNGTSKLLYTLQPPDVTGRIDGWSPDNEHFIFADRSDAMYLANMQGEIAPLGQGDGILGWADARHYVLGNGVVGNVEEISALDEYIYFDPIAFVFLGR